MAQQMIIDAYGCNSDALDNKEQVIASAKAMVACMGAKTVEHVVHRFEPVGITYVAILSTSHLAIHTWPETGYLAVDVFSCSGDIPSQIPEIIQDAFHCKQCSTRVVERSTGEEEQ